MKKPKIKPGSILKEGIQKYGFQFWKNYTPNQLKTRIGILIVTLNTGLVGAIGCDESEKCSPMTGLFTGLCLGFIVSHIYTLKHVGQKRLHLKQDVMALHHQIRMELNELRKLGEIKGDFVAFVNNIIEFKTADMFKIGDLTHYYQMQFDKAIQVQCLFEKAMNEIKHNPEHFETLIAQIKKDLTELATNNSHDLASEETESHHVHWKVR